MEKILNRTRKINTAITNIHLDRYVPLTSPGKPNMSKKHRSIKTTLEDGQFTRMMHTSPTKPKRAMRKSATTLYMADSALN